MLADLVQGTTGSFELMSQLSDFPRTPVKFSIRHVTLFRSEPSKGTRQEHGQQV